VLAGVNFDLGKATIKPGAHAELDNIAEIMNRNPDLRFEIQGHTDSTGNAAFNQQLSERRAAAVMDYLVEKGVAPEKLKSRGLGLKLPAANNDTAEGRAMNRRVEFQPLH
jgi:outer membrane protein OmpA-like peptidoglycan-associated protein